MAIKEIPTKLVEYKTACIKAYSNKKAKISDDLKEKTEESIKLNKRCLDYIDTIKKEYDVDLNSFDEFKDNKYINGKFLRVAKGIYLKGGDDFEITTEVFEIYKYALLLEEIKDLEKELELCNKILSLNKDQYVNIMETFFMKVHEKLVLEGYGYAFGHNIGWICVNRVKQYSKRKLIDYKKTKERKAEILAQGKKLYDKSEDLKYQRLGLEYNGEDYRVYKDNEYNYEVCFIGSKIEGITNFEFIASDWRNKNLRGKTNDDLILECNKKPEEIVKLKVDVKTKVNLCTEADDIFYTKFIRNEDQKSYKTRPINR